MQRTELQYNLQKARALATELRCTLETIDELDTESTDLEDAIECELYTFCEEVGRLEGALDGCPKELIGEGHVKLTVEPFQ